MAVMDGDTKKKLRRNILRRQKDALAISRQADQQIEQLLIRRFDRLISVRRFIFLWVALFSLILFVGALQFRGLSSYYQTLKPVPGGLYHEGMIGTFSNANPLFADGTANSAVSRLVFSGLFKYDNSNILVGDLARGWTLNEAQTRYTVKLKNNIVWHDGKKFTADDVVYTYQTIQNPETQSVLFSSWKDIKVTKQDSLTVVFDLPNPLSAFPYAMTNGIVPKHLLQSINPTQLRSASFNSNPVGTGPFVWKYIDIVGGGTQQREQRLSLTAFDKYWAGKPKLDGINLITYSNEKQLVEAFKKKQVNAMSGLESIPDELKKDSSVQAYTTPLTGAVMGFFNNSKALLSDVKVRRALVAGVDRKAMASQLGQPVQLINGPLLPNQLGFDPTISQLPFNRQQANALLDEAGWMRGENGQRSKAGQPLTINLSSQDNREYVRVARFLQGQWSQLGAKVMVNYYNSEDLQSTVIANHDYEILLYGIGLGVDPDVFAYWDSSQASVGSQGRLNLSEYKSAAADTAIESARTRADQASRVIKYKAFLTAWTQDAPAIALYQPNYLYITRGTVYNYQRKSINSSADRFYNVNQWMIRQQKQKI